MRASRVPAIVGLAFTLAGCVTLPAETVDANAAEARTTLEDASFEGTVGGRSCVSLVLYFQCSWEGADGNFLPYAGNATPLALSGTFAWNAASESTRERVAFLVTDADGDGVYSGDGSLPRARGVSPLAIRFDLAPYRGVRVGVGIGEASDPPIGSSEDPVQPFAFNGNWTVEASSP